MAKNKLGVSDGSGVVHDDTSDMPILKVSELPGSPADRDSRYRGQLPTREKKYLKGHEKVVLIKASKSELPPRPLTPLEVAVKAANADTPDEIGLKGPTVASITLSKTVPLARATRLSTAVMTCRPLTTWPKIFRFW